MGSMLQRQDKPLRKVLITGASFLKCNIIYRLIDWSRYGFKAYMEPAGGMGLLKMTRIDPDILILMDNLAWTDSIRILNKFNIKNSKAEILIITDNPSQYSDERYRGVQLLPASGMNESILVRALQNSGIPESLENNRIGQLLIGDRRQLQRIIIGIEAERILLCRLEPENDPLKMPGVLQKMEELLEKTVPENWFQEISGRYILCFGMIEVGVVEQLRVVDKLVMDLRKRAQKILGKHIAVYMSDSTAKENAIDAYVSLYEMQPYRFFLPSDGIITPSTIRQVFTVKEIRWESVNEKYTVLIEKVICGRKEEAYVIVKSLFYDDIIKCGSHTVYIQIISQIANILKCIAILLDESCMENEVLKGEYWNVEDALNAVLDFLGNLMRTRKEEKKEYSQVVTDTLLTICQHYNDPIYVGSLAKQAGVSESYLSKLFKQQTGMGISKCINYMRIYMAGRDLIRNDTKVAAVAEAHGFYDSKYFSKMFKEIMGYTPSEWRNKYREEQEGL